MEPYTVLESPDSPWRRSRGPGSSAEQGFKLHVSATVLNATEVFGRCVPLITARGVAFKAAANLGMLTQLNMGIIHGFSQVGKFLTIYPETAAQAVALAAELHAATLGLEAPAVPYDVRYARDSIVYYRYGAFRGIEAVDASGNKVPGIRERDGAVVPDRREPGAAIPPWVDNPFPPPFEAPPVEPFGSEILVFEALSQRGKGGVYDAVDLSGPSPRRCVLKEGRHQGELDWDGRDGRSSVQREVAVLQAMEPLGVGVPRVHWTFEADRNSYAVLERIDGDCLAGLLRNARRKLPIDRALDVAHEAARAVAKLHAAGWVWRDCKPLNMILIADGSIRPIDFEGARRADDPTREPYGTPAYMAPELHRAMHANYGEPVVVDGMRSNVPQDLYALGATIYNVFTSFIPDIQKRPLSEGLDHLRYPPLSSKRRGVPAAVQRLVEQLMDFDPHARPSAAEVARRLAVAAAERRAAQGTAAGRVSTVRSGRAALVAAGAR